MTKIPTCLFEKNNLIREGLKSFLAQTDFKVIADYPVIDDVNMVNMPEAPALIIIGVNRQHLGAAEDSDAAFNDRKRCDRRWQQLRG
jgi:hypothetical protein